MSKIPNKPIVFLSHSAKDKDILIPLKELLHKRAAGAIQFFLSSDGESLPLGKNWVVELSDALAKARLMFVFLSENSLDSRWVLFEAGNAYGTKIKVVPVGLPGLDLSDVRPPLSLIQGFNLHSHKHMSNLVRLCNEVCELEMDEEFSADDYHSIFAGTELMAENFFGQWQGMISEVTLSATIEFAPDVKLNPADELERLYRDSGENPIRKITPPNERGYRDMNDIQLPGASYEFKSQDLNATIRYTLSAMFTPELFHLHAPILDGWRTFMPQFSKSNMEIRLHGYFRFQGAKRHQLSTALYKSEARVTGYSRVELKEHEFVLLPTPTRIQFTYTRNVQDLPVRELISLLAQRRVIVENEYDASDVGIPT